MLNNDDLNQLGKLIDQKLEPVKQSLTRIEQKIEREVTDLAEPIGEIMTKLDVLDDHEERISNLEEELHIPHPHKH